MNWLSSFEIADMHKLHMVFGAASGNARLAAKLHAKRFPNRHSPDHRVFTRLHQRLRDTGSLEVDSLEVNSLEVSS